MKCVNGVIVRSVMALQLAAILGNQVSGILFSFTIFSKALMQFVVCSILLWFINEPMSRVNCAFSLLKVMSSCCACRLIVIARRIKGRTSFFTIVYLIYGKPGLWSSF